MQLFLRTDAFYEKMYPNLSEAVNYYKQSEGGKCEMCKSIESYAQEYARDYIEKEKKEIIKRLLLRDADSVEEIADLCGVSIECVKEVQEELLALA